MIFQMLLALSLGVFAESPEALLDSLCANASGPSAVRYWQQAGDPEGTVPSSHPDTLGRILGNCTGISVEPGEDRMGESGATYYVREFPDARWTWVDSAGSNRQAIGATEVVFRDGSYRWRKVPLSAAIAESGVSSGQQLLLALVATALAALLGGMAVWWAKRRWG